jgi:hypothetical protein
MAGVVFLPLEATADKGGGAISSYAHTAQKLRERTGRLDPALAGHAARCDAGFVALYAHDDAHGAVRGVARFTDVSTPPPRRGRPLVAATLPLAGVVRMIVARAMTREAAVWGEAEPETLGASDPELGGDGG